MRNDQTNVFSGLLDQLAVVADPRDPTKVKYPLDEILFLAVCGVVSDCTEWQQIVDFGKDKLEWLRNYLPYAKGIPSLGTMNRIFSLINKSSFEGMFRTWASRGLCLPEGSLVSLDGKALRRSATKKEQQTPHTAGGKGAVHLLEAWCSEQSVCFGVREVASKENETVAIPLILNDLEIEKCVVRIDAIGSYKEVVRSIKGKEADYVIGLKGNQATLLAAAEVVFSDPSLSRHLDIHDSGAETGHGRLERRVCRAISVGHLSQQAKVEDWAGLKSVFEVESERSLMATGKVSHEKRYYISSLEPLAEKGAKYVREHWGIENGLHYCLDVFFGEDASRKRTGNAAANFGTVLRMALNMVNAIKGNMSIKRTLKKASRSDVFREQILGFS